MESRLPNLPSEFLADSILWCSSDAIPRFEVLFSRTEGPEARYLLQLRSNKGFESPQKLREWGRLACSQRDLYFAILHHWYFLRPSRIRSLTSLLQLE